MHVLVNVHCMVCDFENSLVLRCLGGREAGHSYTCVESDSSALKLKYYIYLMHIIIIRMHTHVHVVTCMYVYVHVCTCMYVHVTTVFYVE